MSASCFSHGGHDSVRVDHNVACVGVELFELFRFLTVPLTERLLLVLYFNSIV